MVSRLRDMLELEAKDKQFLLNSIEKVMQMESRK
jgi:hypothetical protein